jgi:hypothetical protein
MRAGGLSSHSRAEQKIAAKALRRIDPTTVAIYLNAVPKLFTWATQLEKATPS